MLTKMTKKTQKIRRGMKSLPKMEKETFFRKKDYAETQRVFWKSSVDYRQSDKMEVGRHGLNIYKDTKTLNVVFNGV
jgi:hypothetical protein